ncbi:MAG: LuxR family transcriptional regulator [Gammaproteobacteria bacterium]|nr:LuxR family transcriptional regulator [Gammaproteobacteria bacterium]
MLTPDLEAFGARLAAVRRFDTAFDLLADEVRALGFDGVDYASSSAARVLDGGWAGGPIFERNFPRGWQHGWRVHGRFDPILPASYRQGLPVDWQAIRGETSLTSAQRRALALLDDMGFPAGLTVPIHLPANRFAFVSGVSRRTGEEWASLCRRTKAPLLVLAHTFHHLLAERHDAAAVRLTRRELECLQFAAWGCAAPLTARRLNRSVETVRRHLKSAMARLGARTVAQAVAIAVACGLLEAGSGDSR